MIDAIGCMNQWRELPYEESNTEVIAEETDRKDILKHSEEHKRHWLLFCKSTTTLENISHQLQSACGDDVIIVVDGADFQKHNQSHYTINLSDQKHYSCFIHLMILMHAADRCYGAASIRK